MRKQLSLLCLSFFAVTALAITSSAADGDPASRADQIGNAIFNLVIEVGITTFLVHMALGLFAGVELKKRGTIILAAALLVVYAVLLFFPQVPIPRI